MIIGCGSGRCGTGSLAILLKSHGINATHELRLLPWTKDLDQFDELLKAMGNDADVSFTWLNYIENLVYLHPGVAIICLKRDREDTVKSWMKKVHPDANYWTDPSSKYWDSRYIYTGNSYLFPKYDAPKEEAIGLYWDEYYRKIEQLTDKFPLNIATFPSPDIFKEKGLQDRMFDFMGD